MGEDIRPIGSVAPHDLVSDRRGSNRRRSDRRASSSRELAPLEGADPAEPDTAQDPARSAPTPPPDANPAAFTAQILGQGGAKRGIKGGPPVLESARSTYLGSEYSGAADRRPKPGRIKDTDV